MTRRSSKFNPPILGQTSDFLNVQQLRQSEAQLKRLDVQPGMFSLLARGISVYHVGGDDMVRSSYYY